MRTLPLVILALAAVSGCGGTVIFGEEGAGGDGDRAPSPGRPTPSGPTGPTGAGGEGTVTVSVGPGGGFDTSGPTGGGTCSLGEVFGDPQCDTCALDACCAELEACLDDFDLCVTPDGEIDPALPIGAAVLACLTTSCSGPCGLPPPADSICGSELILMTDDAAADAAFMGCFNASCCDAFAPCTADGDVQACVDCLVGDGDPDRCEGADACAVEACGVGLAFIAVCGVDLDVRGFEASACVEKSCCSEVVACTSDGADVAACEACLDSTGGPLCDDLRTCRAELCGL